MCTSVINPRAMAVILRVDVSLYCQEEGGGERYALMFALATASTAHTEMADIMNTSSNNLTERMPRPAQRISPWGQREAVILSYFE